MKRIGLIVSLLIFVVGSSFGQVSTSQSGDWNDSNTWDCGCIPTFSDGPITVLANHSVTIPNGFTADADEITVAGDGSVTVENGGRLIVRSSGGADLVIEEADFITTFSDGLLTVESGGVLENRSVVTSNSSNLVINGEYEHNRNGGDIPTANWTSGSTVRVTGITNTAISGGLGQSFHHFIWNSSSQSAAIILNGGMTTIGGDFTVSSTNNQFLILGYTAGTSTGSLTVSGNLSVSGASKFYISAVATYALNVIGDFSVSSTASNFPLLGTATGAVTLTVGGQTTITSAQPSRFIASSGSFTFNSTGSITLTNTALQFSAGAGNAVVNLTGSLTMNSSSITEISTGTGTINFVGAGPHLLSKSGGSISNTIHITNAVGSTLDLGTSILEGTGDFTNNGTLRVGSIHPSGALQSTTINDIDCGNIIMAGTRTFANPSSIVYSGSALQFIGDGHPTSAGVDITVENINGVSIIAPTTLAGAINLTNGDLNVNNSSLTITGSITGSNNITVGSTGSISLGGSANIGTFPFPAGAQTFSNFTLNNSNGITFANDVTLTGVLTLTSGALRFNDQVLALDGTLNVTSGSLSSNSNSTLEITGEGAFGSALNFASGGNTIGTLVIDRTVSGVVEINSTLTVANSLVLENGQFQNTNGLTMGNGSTLTRRGGTLTNDRPDIVSGSYNVVYNSGSSINTSLELPAPADATQLNNLTISGPTVLTQNITVNGNVSLTSGTFTAGTNTITMQGSTWSRNGGSFVPGTGQVIFNGTTSITSSSGNPQFGNIRVESGRSLTFPSTTVNISGNITFLAGSTINSGSGTILLSGTNAQTIGGGGSTLNNITVTKTGGSVSLTSALNITGILNITTAHVFSSANNLTLISTSDGTSGNASIADLSGGGSVTGDVTVQRFMSAEARFWRYLSSPIQNATVESWKDDFPITGTFSDPSTAGEWPVFTPPINSASPSLYRYNESVAGVPDLGWEAYPASGTAISNSLEVGRGYSAFIRNTGSTIVDVTGPINSGDVSLPVTLTGSPSVDNGWNLVGNPYPSSINWDDANWTKTNMSGSIQVRDDPGGIFRTWNGSMGSLGSGEIAMGQAFWVQASASGPVLTAREQTKTNVTGAFYRQEEEVVTDAFEIVLAKGNEQDFTYVWFKTDATEGYDTQYDVVKFHNDIFDFSSFANDDTRLSINTLNQLNCMRSLKFDISSANQSYNLAGTYEMTFNALGAIDPGLNLVLYDHFTDTTTPVQGGTTYSFEITPDENSFGSNRFELISLSGTPDFAIGETTGATSCNPGSVTLTASGAPEGGVYRWYENETDETPVFESTSQSFTTPALDKSKTYYVSAALSQGCESNRVAVAVEVVLFDEITIEKNGNTLISNYESGNQWYLGDELIPDATGQEFMPSESGIYTVQTTVGECTTSAQIDFIITDLEQDFAAEWSYYPNPVTDVLTIKTRGPVNQVNTIAVLNSLGVEIGQINLNNDGVGYFDMKSRPNGFYVVKILGFGKSVNFKIIKQ